MRKFWVYTPSLVCPRGLYPAGFHHLLPEDAKDSHSSIHDPDSCQEWTPYLDSSQLQVGGQLAEHALVGQVEAAVEVLSHLALLLLACEEPAHSVMLVRPAKAR